jgi:hypothetical protein
MVPDLSHLPGGERIQKGLNDHLTGSPETIDGLLLSIAHTILRDLGVPIPLDTPTPEPELALYEALGRTDVPDPYAAYNALLRELISFRRALEREVYADARGS